VSGVHLCVWWRRAVLPSLPWVAKSAHVVMLVFAVFAVFATPSLAASRHRPLRGVGLNRELMRWERGSWKLPPHRPPPCDMSSASLFRRSYSCTPHSPTPLFSYVQLPMSSTLWPSNVSYCTGSWHFAFLQYVQV